MLEGGDFVNCINRSIARMLFGSLWEQGVQRERLLQAVLSQDAARTLLGMGADNGLSRPRAESILLGNYEVINKDNLLAPRY